MDTHFAYNTVNGHFYITLKGQRKERCIYRNHIGVYYLNKGNQYLSGNLLAKFEKLRTKVHLEFN